MVPFTTLVSLVSPNTATVLPSSVFSFCSSWMRIVAERSGMSPAVTMRPGGALSIIAWVRLNVISTRCCWLAMHACASPEKSMNVPTTANTWSSCANDVHSGRM